MRTDRAFESHSADKREVVGEAISQKLLAQQAPRIKSSILIDPSANFGFRLYAYVCGTRGARAINKVGIIIQDDDAPRLNEVIEMGQVAVNHAVYVYREQISPKIWGELGCYVIGGAKPGSHEMRHAVFVYIRAELDKIERTAVVRIGRSAIAMRPREC